MNSQAHLIYLSYVFPSSLSFVMLMIIIIISIKLNQSMFDFFVRKTAFARTKLMRSIGQDGRKSVSGHSEAAANIMAGLALTSAR